MSVYESQHVYFKNKHKNVDVMPFLVIMHESKIVSKCILQERKPFLEKTIKLLLKRGSDPNISTVPMPSLFFAVKSADMLAVESLLAKDVDTSTKIEKVLVNFFL